MFLLSPVPGQRPPHQRVLDENIVLDSPEDAVEEMPDGSVEFEGAAEIPQQQRRSGVEPISRRADGGHPGRYWLGQDYLVQLIPRRTTPPGDSRVGGRCAGRGGHRARKDVLFSGTVRENLRWKLDASDELWAAYRVACAAEFLERMPRAWTPPGPGGVNVSGRQKQRLCIARTLLKRPKILIFDDHQRRDTATRKIRTALAELRI
ncbi:MAG: ATP-binding cassette domain-containing protein [Evtepia gabavorous]